MIKFNFSNWAISLDSISAQQFDDNTIEMQFLGDFQTAETENFVNWNAYIKNNSNLDLLTLYPVTGGYGCLLSRNSLAFTGPYYVQVLGNYIDENEEYHERHSNKAEFIVPSSIDGDAQWTVLPRVFTEAVHAAQEAAADAESSAERVEHIVAPFEPGDACKVLRVNESESGTEWAPSDQSRIEDVEKLIPAQATETNKLADKDFVNSTVGTNTAIFRGTFNSVAQLEAYSGDKTNNDYAFVIIYDSVTALVSRYDRYKYNGTAWVFEYSLNNSSFTAEQWASIQSGITAAKVAFYDSKLTDNIFNGFGVLQANWTAETGGGYSKSITVNGIKGTDMPYVDLNLASVAFANIEDINSAWSLVYRVEASADDTLKFYALEDVEVNIPFKVRCVR